MLTPIRMIFQVSLCAILLLFGLSYSPVLSQNFNPIQIIKWSADGTRLAISYYDGTIEVRDAATGQTTRTFNAAGFASIAWSPNANRLAAANIYGDVWIWDVTTGTALVTIQAQETPAGIAWSPDGSRIATGHQLSTGLDERGTIRIWDATSGQLLSTFEAIFSTVSVYEWSPDGTRLSGLGGRGVIVWDVINGTPLASLAKENECGEADVECAVPHISGGAWSPDGTKLLTAGSLEIQIWNTTTYETQTVFAEFGTVRGLAWSPDGTNFTITSDNTVKVWDISTEEIIATYTNSTTNPIYSVAWSPDGNSLAFQGENNSLQIIRAPGVSTATPSPNW